MLGNKAFENRVNKILALQSEIDDLMAEVDAIKDELKADMLLKDVNEVVAGDHKVRYKDVTSMKFDTKAFKTALPDMYTMYATPQTTKRFTIA